MSVPRHVAIIMDGNGRWAEQRGYRRTRGHREGCKRADEVITRALDSGVKFLTLYTFSTENWNRPPTEVSFLMKVVVEQLSVLDRKFIDNRVKLLVQGNLSRVPGFAKAELLRVSKITQFPDPAMTVVTAFSYGGRQEIVEACKAMARKAKEGQLDPDSIDEESFRQYLNYPEIPDPDLLIRTGGDSRVSNFLLWQIAYSEIFITPTLWPDFYADDFSEVLEKFGSRERRFGLTSAQVADQRLDVEPPPP